MTALQITIGRSRKNPRGRSVPLPDGIPAARGLATLLESQPTSVEAWWSQHTWREGHRASDRWESACAIAVDIDYQDANGVHTVPPATVVEQLELIVRDGKLPGSIWHRTPRGFRVAFAFANPVTDREVFARAARGAATLLQAAIHKQRLVGYVIDEKALLDLARLLYSPRAEVDGVKRDAQVLLLREDPYDPIALAPPPTKPRLAPALTFKEASDRYNLEHPGDWPRNSGTCPACGHNDCFGRLPEDATRWACFSVSHQTPGVRGPGCWHGDALDMDAFRANCTAAELLKRGGYLSPASPSLTAITTQPAQQSMPGIPAASIEQARLKGLGKTYASLCAIIRNDRRILPAKPEWDEMLCSPVVEGEELEDHDTGRIREKLELNCTDSKGKALQFEAGEIEKAIYQVAHEKAFHPVREFLEQLPWDGIPRIAAVVDELLGLERTTLHLALIRRWFIGAVARIFRPGCELQMVLVFCGPEDLGKSRFFKTLFGAEWFSDESMDMRDKDARLLLQRVWCLEWGELAAMRSSAWEETKAFITRTMNDFRQPYGRKLARKPRHCVIVGTANEEKFLLGREGERRFWPLAIPRGHEIPLDKVAEWRDQLWAEAVHLFRAGEQWHLTAEEKALLRESHSEKHIEQHPWEDLVAEWLTTWTAPVTTSVVLEKAIRKPTFQWNRGDQMAVASVLKRLGWERPGDKGRPRGGERVWTRESPTSANHQPQKQVGDDQVGDPIPEQLMVPIT